MATLKEYFDVDFANALTCHFTWQCAPAMIDIVVKVGIETYSAAKFAVYYVPLHQDHLRICGDLINKLSEALAQASDVLITMTNVGQIDLGCVGSSYSKFSKRVYIYSEDDFSGPEIAQLEGQCRARSIWLSVRGADYVRNRVMRETPLAFVCHDLRDKEAVAKHVAVGLQQLMCPVCDPAP